MLRKINKVVSCFKSLYTSVNLMFAIRACFCIVYDSITKHEEMKYINLLRGYVKQEYEARIIELSIKTEKHYLPKIDFGMKIPVWICWFQGEESMPALVRCCYKNLKNKIPSNSEIVLITKENYLDYMDIPLGIINKVECGVFSFTNFSDLIRCKLLATYGGMWIDSTVYVGYPIQKELLDADFYSQKTDTLFFKKRFVTESRWASWLMVCNTKVGLFQLVGTILEEYMINSNAMIDYYLIDYIIELMYETIPSIRQCIDEVDVNNVDAFELVNILNEPYDDKRLSSFLGEHQFNKLSNSFPFINQMCSGTLTNYYKFIVENSR